jgi:hypothetical protein
MTESTEQSRFVRWAKAQGFFVRKLESTSNKGFPDLIVADPKTRRHFFMEMKDSAGRESAHQKLTAKLMRDCGIHVVTAWSAEQARAATDAIFRSPEHLGEFGS